MKNLSILQNISMNHLNHLLQLAQSFYKAAQEEATKLILEKQKVQNAFFRNFGQQFTMLYDTYQVNNPEGSTHYAWGPEITFQFKSTQGLDKPTKDRISDTLTNELKQYIQSTIVDPVGHGSSDPTMHYVIITCLRDVEART